MEKTFYLATLAFGWFIAISLAVFSVFAFKLAYPLIGIILVAVTIASAAVNILFQKRFKATRHSFK